MAKSKFITAGELLLNTQAPSCRIPERAEDKLDKPAPASS